MAKFYSVQDIKAESYGNPMLLENDEMAKRALTGAVNQEGSLLYSNPEDFKLFCIGKFDRQTGLISSQKEHFICSALDLKTIPTD